MVEEVSREGGYCISLRGRSVPIDAGRLRLVNRNGPAMSWSRYDVSGWWPRAATRPSNGSSTTSSPIRSSTTTWRSAIPRLTGELSGRLSAWSEGLSGRYTDGQAVELDPETKEQLRALGYLE